MSVTYADLPNEEGEVSGQTTRQVGRSSYSTRLVAGVSTAALLAGSAGACLALTGTSRVSRGPLRGAVSAATVLHDDDDEGGCAELWGQCGGDGYTGPTCCEEGKCEHMPLDDYESYKQCIEGDVLAEVESGESEPAGEACGGLWDQCGGEGYEGSTCCDEGLECQDKPLDELKSYRQCRKPENKGPSQCAAPEPGSPCMTTILNNQGAAWSNPDAFHGLHGDFDLKEFQQMAHLWEFDSSQCPPPCAPGTCYFILHVEGCDTIESWYCEQDDGSLKYACCCNYFNEEEELDPPENPAEDMQVAMKAAESDSPSLFCTAMCMPTGYELGLLRHQYENGQLGLFGCNEWDVYSNETLRLTPVNETPAYYTPLINGSLSAKIGGSWGTALNTEVFVRFWDKVLENNKTWNCDWVVKVDPDTMWLPVRLRALLVTSQGTLGTPEPEEGRFLNNCHVGLHGPIEVVSIAAMKTYQDGKDSCREGKISEIGQEDLFISTCFESLGIQKANAYNLMLEATLACQEVPSSIYPDRPPCFAPQVAFHPFKSETTWMRCHEEASNHPYALPVNPVEEGPSDANERHG